MGKKQADSEYRSQVFGGFRTMWLITMFDLPVTSKEEKDDYRKFHDFLLADGYTMMQYSVYMRPCPSEENAAVHRKRVKAALPPNGEVRILTFTDKQFERMQVFVGKTRAATEKAPAQIEFF